MGTALSRPWFSGIEGQENHAMTSNSNLRKVGTEACNFQPIGTCRPQINDVHSLLILIRIH